MLPQVGRNVEARKGSLAPPLRRQGDAAQAGDALAAEGEAHPVADQALALATDAPRGLLRFRRHADDGQRPPVACQMAIQTRAEGAGIPGIGLYPFPVGAPVPRPYDQVMHAERRQPAMEDVAKRSGLVAAVHRLSGGQLSVHKADKSLLTEPLGRLGGLSIHLPHYHNETGMYIQPELNYPSASARHCIRVLIRGHSADSLAPRAPLVRPMSYWVSAVAHTRRSDVKETGELLV